MSHVRARLRTELVWDMPVRVFHWTLVLGFFIAYFSEGKPLILHIWAGYVVAALVLLRIMWGFVGSPHARFSDFVFPLRQMVHYLNDELHFRARRFIGHSPAGGGMVIVLLFTLLATTMSGMAALAVDRGRGPLSPFVSKAAAMSDERGAAVPTIAAGTAGSGSPAAEFWEEVHESIANAALVLVILHICGVLLASISHKENLVAAMLDGRKRP